MRIGPAAPRRTWRSCWRPTRRGKRPTRACSSTAASASPANTMSSASSVRRGSTRSHRFRPTSSSPTWPSTCSACRVRSEPENAVRPLEGITVVTLEHAIAAPFCTRQLADLGARVIKIERPGVGDFARAYDERVRGLASHFVWTNRSKESLTLDVKHAEAAAILDKLVARADVVVQNLAPGAAARLGLSYEALHERYPRLVVCDISGYGPDGPYRDKKAYDLLIQSESGFVSITGTPDEPAKAGCSIADIAAAMYAYSNILAALIQRGKTGK